MSILEHLIPAAHAHEKWFVTSADAQAYTIPESFLSLNLMTGALLAVLTVVFVAGHLLDRKYERSSAYEKASLHVRPLRKYAVDVLAVSVGVMLVYSAWNGVLLADNYFLPATMLGTALRGLEFGVGVLLIVGLFAKESGVLLLILYVALFGLVPWIEPFDCLYFVGIAVFLSVFSRSANSLDGMLGRSQSMRESTRQYAYDALRVLTGIAVIVLAFGKLFRPGLHFALMDAYPDFNPYVIAQWMGIHMSREFYVFMLFGVEVTVGILVTAGYFLRLASVLLVSIFVGSIFFLGQPELMGHLPLLGILFVFFAYGNMYGKPKLQRADTKTRPE